MTLAGGIPRVELTRICHKRALDLCSQLLV
jgi:hypothetical protein